MCINVSAGGTTSTYNNLGRVLVQTMDAARHVVAGTRFEFPIVSRRTPGLPRENEITTNNNRILFLYIDTTVFDGDGGSAYFKVILTVDYDCYSVTNKNRSHHTLLPSPFS